MRSLMLIALGILIGAAALGAIWAAQGDGEPEVRISVERLARRPFRGRAATARRRRRLGRDPQAATPLRQAPTQRPAGRSSALRFPSRLRPGRSGAHARTTPTCASRAARSPRFSTTTSPIPRIRSVSRASCSAWSTRMTRASTAFARALKPSIGERSNASRSPTGTNCAPSSSDASPTSRRRRPPRWSRPASPPPSSRRKRAQRSAGDCPRPIGSNCSINTWPRTSRCSARSATAEG